MISPARGFIAPNAEIINVDLRLGREVFIGERVVIAWWPGSLEVKSTEPYAGRLPEGCVSLGDRVRIDRETYIELFPRGQVTVGPDAWIESRSLLIALVQPIAIGERVHIGAYSVFFSYNHGIAPRQRIIAQPAESKGPIVVEDDVRIGARVTVLSGVTIGRGAVVAAGSVVNQNVPPGATVAGTPARLVHSSDAARARDCLH